MKQYDYDVTFDGLLEGKIKRRLRWWPILFAVISIVLLITLALLFGGCAMLEHADKEGNVTKYWRVGDQTIGVGNATLPDGTVLNFTEQKSELPKVEITATSIKIGGKAVKP